MRRNAAEKKSATNTIRRPAQRRKKKLVRFSNTGPIDKMDQVDIIIPTWNAMPEFEKTLSSLLVAFKQNEIHNVIVMDRESTDGTIELAEEHGCDVVIDTKSLGSARLNGLKRARTEWISFIDSDIELLDDWYALIKHEYRKIPLNEKVGWLFGRTLDEREKVRRIQLWEAENKNGLYGGFLGGPNIVPMGRRGFTNNTLCLREPLLKAEETNIREVSGHEDWVLSQVLMKQGYSIVEVPLFCNHLRVHTYGKWGTYTEAWNIYGQFKAGLHPTMKKYFWILRKGILFTVIFNDSWYFFDALKHFRAVLRALKEPVEWDRSKK